MQSEINIKELFWSLVSNQFIPDFNYQYRFSFETVIYQTNTSYCLCECGFEHEYLECISENGELNEEIYNKILENILNGKCPHVDKVDKLYVGQTNISAAHIVAAVGTEQALNYMISQRHTHTGIFGLSPFRIALLRENIKIVNLLNQDVNGYRYGMSEYVVCSRRSRINRQYLETETIYSPLFCVRTKNVTLLKTLLNSEIVYGRISDTFELALKHDLKDAQDELLKYIIRVQHKDLTTLKWSAISAIVYDRPDVLHKLSQELSCRSIRRSRVLSQLKEISELLQRTACTAVLNSIKDDIQIRPSSVLCAIQLLEKDFHYHNEEIKTKLKASFQIRKAINSLYNENNGTFLHRGVIYSPYMVKAVLEFGADVDTLNRNGETPLLSLLSHFFPHLLSHFFPHPISKLREFIRLLFNENPSLELNKYAVEKAINLDEALNKDDLIHSLNGELLMDSELHSFLGAQYDNNNPLNYFGPLFIECGFPVTEDILYNALEKPLHRVELEYFRQVLTLPRSLKLSCRDVIRKHYKRNQLHSFINKSNMPQRIKDFILLKDLLSLQAHNAESTLTHH